MDSMKKYELLIVKIIPIYGMFNHGHEDEMAAIMQTFLIQLACYNSILIQISLKFATTV